MSSETKIVTEQHNPLFDTNIVNNEKFHENVRFVLNEMAESVAMTLGPGGGYTFISVIDNTMPVYPTKDGYTVVMEYKFNDQIKYFIAEVIKDISKRMNDNVGDGTTSGLLIARTLYNSLMEYDITKKYPEIGCKLPFPSIRMILETIRSVIVERISENEDYIIKNPSKEKEDELLRRVAVSSANNNPDIGLKVAELFTTRGSDNLFVTVETTFEDEDEIERNVGFEFGSGFLHPNMANQPDKVTCRMEDPKFLLVDGPLTAHDMTELSHIIEHVNETMHKPLIIVAREYDQVVMNDIIKRTQRFYDSRGNFVHEKENIAALIVNTTHESSKDRLEDLRIILGGTVLTTSRGQIISFKNNVTFLETLLGGADEFVGSQLRSRIKNGHGDKEAVKARIQSLEESLKTLENLKSAGINDVMSIVSTDKVRRRIAMLNSDMTVIKVGGANEKERRTKKLIYDDAVAACQAAIRHGFTLGGNVSIPTIIRNDKSSLSTEITEKLTEGDKLVIVGNDQIQVYNIVKDILEIVAQAFKAAYTRVVANMIGEGTKMYEKIVDDIYGGTFKTHEMKSVDVPIVYNLVTGRYTDVHHEHALLSPGNIDFEMMSSVFGAVGNLISSNQLLSILPGESVVFKSRIKKDE